MKNNSIKNTFFLRIGLILSFVVIFLCVSFYIFLQINFHKALSNESSSDNNFFLQIIIFIICCIPFFVLVIDAFINSFKNLNNVITRLKNYAIIIFVDSVIFSIMQILFYIFLKNYFSIYYLIFAFLGYAFATLVLIIYYVNTRKVNDYIFDKNKLNIRKGESI